MTDQAMSPLRRRMIEDMTIRKFAPKTQHDYLQRVKNFATYLGRSPDTASSEDVRRYQLHLTASGVGVPTVNQTVSRELPHGGHVARCEECAHSQISYNSCRNRHCAKCQGAAAKDWLAAREADLLPVPYYHVVFTLPAAIADIAYQNKAVIYDLLFKASAETLITIAADPKHLGARVGITSVLHTWGSAMTHHPHVPASHPRKSDRHTRCLSTGHGRARPDVRLSSHIVRQLTEFDAIHRSSSSRFTIHRFAGAHRLHSHTSSAALKSP